MNIKDIASFIKKHIIRQKEHQEEYIEPKHEVKVTNISEKYHCRLFKNGELVSEIQCDLKEDIVWCCREMLRWQDKMGYVSRFTSAARERHMKTPKPKGKYHWILYEKSNDENKQL